MSADYIAGLFDVAGKRALVTGATSGIGRMIARGLAQAGVEVWVVARGAGDVEAIVAELGGHAQGVAADVATEEGIARVAEALGDRPLHILVNNAGTDRPTPLDADGREDFDAVLSLNLTAPFLLTRKLLPSLESGAAVGDPARVINIASIAALNPGHLENFAYASSKSGVAMMSRHLGRHLAKRNISCNAIAPGLFPSRLTEKFLGMSAGDAVPKSFVTPLGARAGEMDDIAGAVIYLSSRAGAWVTGVLLPVSGGIYTVT
ncbi:SDR family NAD(P)-dependent oxidoreductase [Sphingopyxis sp.]|uniref:SDR family NAD(P)-dependent oxidoreductase n=1 Tax=Sphingopyxis sp. TaxID=1908224 RepID=UPI002D76D9A8|nr:SDR family NAD(P)-dependent oxidoreductase [Sphingopyxis sp.]HET6524416.1 SDR family NAD(P)-dependent oxidoreductase [Sphingopyxis sp.]